ncbi:glucose-1-phosphate adenylyltransferase [Dokdonia pacifica]|uniref:Glucose-1-phosphate adenylyltransferase n=1 Tax=Dokdonia pacifica TaxID=1627892 RepID=A0A238ZE82_9FLAO|nr:glucose-1-phosphate adenylyltransferase [Dokdonia pacifica]GGG05758.1 glucose-1-phosphate adenylyltransferase [Dokdonia pacifica]SNR81308.1 glucose-1-phosphate adenylyltransferase [Dokdonia pacifica]
MNKKVLAIILGGGQGSRLYPLTKMRSKPAVPIAGKYRLVDIPISNCINSNIKRMFVLTQFNSASLNKHIKHTYQFSYFSDAFVDILAAEQTPENKGWFQGTADAVRQSMHHFKGYESDYILILSGDQLYQMDFNKMLDAHIEAGAKISVASLPVNAKDATSFGILKTNDDQTIGSFIEKPDTTLLPEWKSPVSPAMKKQGKHYLASMGIYIFNKDLLVDLLEDTDTMDFGKEIIPQSINDHKVLSYAYEGYWTDIGNIDSFFEANIDLTADIPKFNLFNRDQSILTRPRVLPPTKISGTTLEKSIIAEGSIIHGSRIANSVIGIRSRVGKGTVIENSYVMGSNRFLDLEEIDAARANGIPHEGIGDRCFITNCIIDKNVKIGDDVRITGGKHLEDVETDTYVVRDGIVVVKNGALIPSGTII